MKNDNTIELVEPEDYVWKISGILWVASMAGVIAGALSTVGLVNRWVGVYIIGFGVVLGMIITIQAVVSHLLQTMLQQYKLILLLTNAVAQGKKLEVQCVTDEADEV